MTTPATTTKLPPSQTNSIGINTSRGKQHRCLRDSQSGSAGETVGLAPLPEGSQT